MRAFLKLRFLVALLAVVTVASVGVWFFLFRQPPDLREYFSIRRADWEVEPDDKNHPANRSVALAKKYPGSVGAVSALLLAATNAPDTPAGKEAYQLFAGEIETADIRCLAQAFDWSLGRLQTIEKLAPTILARVRKDPDHPRTARLLAAVCTMTRPREEGDPPPSYLEAADLIADRYADSPDLTHFCEGLGASPNGSPPWAGRFERHLRAIVEVNQDRRVRCAARFALASVVQSSSGDRQAEAEVLFEQFCDEFDGKRAYRYQHIEQLLLGLARDQLAELRFRAVGKPAPEMTGVDLDDRSMTLSQYRGRVVLLNFWGTWCFPCMKLIPHEIALVEQFRGQPFEIIGVNCDDDIQKARDAVMRTKMTWRSFRNQAGQGPAITSQWKVLGYPTLYLIDHHGIIRKRWVGSPPPEELSRVAGVLVDAARRKVPADAMQPIVAALKPPASTAPAKPATPAPRSGTGFVDKVYRAGDAESKYVVFVPRSYDGTKAFPAILFLHGAGSRGSDGRRHLQHGLAKTIRAKNEDFPFIH
jgi:thiol-disulfide isomerase/thioredoxin